jgi:hypothetical protein
MSAGNIQAQPSPALCIAAAAAVSGLLDESGAQLLDETGAPILPE